MDRITVTLQVKIAWWWPAYVAGIRLMHWLTGLEPDPVKVEHWAKRAVSIRVEKL